MSFNQFTQTKPAKQPVQPRKKVIAIGSPAKREPALVSKLRRAFLNIETQAAGRVTIGMN